MEVSQEDIKLAFLALLGPGFITVVCLTAMGKERWVMGFGVLLFVVILVALIRR